MSWYLLSVIGFLGFGLQNFFSKVAAHRGYNSALITLWTFVFSAVAIWGYLFVTSFHITLSAILIFLVVLYSPPMKMPGERC